MERILTPALPGIEVLGLDDVAAYDEPVEDQPTFEGNALLKARAGLAATGLPSLADDSGLCVDALNGMPGVLSARWAGPRPKDDAANNRLLLDQLADVPDERRGAQFRCAVAFCHPAGRGVVARRDAGPGDPRAAGERRLRLRRAVRPRRQDGELTSAEMTARRRTRSPTAASRCARSRRSWSTRCAAERCAARRDSNPHAPAGYLNLRGCARSFNSHCAGPTVPAGRRARVHDPVRATHETPVSGGQSRPRSRRSLATWPVALTLYCASSSLPSSSTTNVERMTPSTVLP